MFSTAEAQPYWLKMYPVKEGKSQRTQSYKVTAFVLLICAASVILATRQKFATVYYEVMVRTSDKQKASSKNHAFLQLIGNRGSTKEFYMENKKSDRLFKRFVRFRGETNNFKFSGENVGKLSAIRIGHLDKINGNSGLGSPDASDNQSWHCYDVTVKNCANQDKFVFLVNQWLPVASKVEDAGVKVDLHKVEESLISQMKTLSSVKYLIEVYTGDEKGAGTDANVFIQLYGENGDSGKQKLSKKFRDLFEKGQKDDFTLEFLDLGPLVKLTVEHDNSKMNPGWLLDRIEITNLSSNDVTIFACNKWLDKNKGDGSIKRDLLPRK